MVLGRAVYTTLYVLYRFRTTRILFRLHLGLVFREPVRFVMLQRAEKNPCNGGYLKEFLPGSTVYDLYNRPNAYAPDLNVSPGVETREK